jgi:FtsP/CotA-like multicopper oxidase with cupredoxin domain
MDLDRMTRRGALSRGFGGVALVCSFKFDPKQITRGRVTSAKARAAAAGAFAPFARDLPVPPVIRPVGKQGLVEQYVVTAKPGVAEILPGLPTPVLGYNGLFPGPTFHARRGVPVEVRQINNLGRDETVHLHGGVTEPHSDGHPNDFFADGTERLYRYSNVQHASTLWYHDHSHGQTALTLYAGLAAFYLLSDPDEDELELPRGDYDVPLMIQDRAFNADGTFRYRVDIDKGFRGDTILVNGAIAPRMKVQRRLYRLRFLNASNARPYSLVLGNNREMIQIAGDGGLLPRPVKRTVIEMEPAERVEVVVDFRQFGAGSEVVLHNAVGEASTSAVMRFDVVRGGAEEARVPKVLRDPISLPPVNAQREWPLTFQGLGQAQWQIGGAGLDLDRIDCRPRLGSSELWTFTNYSQRTHPMHLHCYHFQIVSIDGKPPQLGDAGLKDTVRVGPNQKVVVRPWFDYYAGRYVFHCHASEHGDMSMMGQMETVA